MLKRIISNSRCTVDQYEQFGWVTFYNEHDSGEALISELKDSGIAYAVQIRKNRSGLPSQPEILFGEVPKSFVATEDRAKYEIRCLETFHAGLFLDHQRTREWLTDHAKNQSVLNLFSYTGSLAIAAALGGAIKSMSIDLSNPSTQWAKKNAQLNHLSAEHLFIKGDVFDWTKRFKKKSQTFDIVISDPPSQSRSDELHFTTQKHLDLLHERCIDCVAPSGTLITSINTETITHDVMIASVHHTAEKLKRKIKNYTGLPLPEGFESEFRSMKGLRVTFAN